MQEAFCFTLLIQFPFCHLFINGHGLCTDAFGVPGIFQFTDQDGQVQRQTQYIPEYDWSQPVDDTVSQPQRTPEQKHNHIEQTDVRRTFELKYFDDLRNRSESREDTSQ
jgi:hypothetical protein